ncbi:ABC transporter ATP-binding protein [Roseovarius sp. S1116L3]|uniref:ABC transporter ATP-binding protein n=1 Tax=Roseovarius roseus TaxID=3342636 RepID=UPI003727BDB8
MKNSLTFNGVGKTYGATVALRPTDLEIKAGEFLTLLGPSGSGKTTLLMALAGFVQPSSGSILLDGQDITGIPPESRNFGVVFQGYALFPHLTVWENVYFPLRARNLGRAKAREAVGDALALMELEPYAERMPAALSGGQQQRVALARALVFKPELLLLDEPLSALDKSLRKTLQTELKELHRKVGTTFVYVTHDQEEALSMSDRIAILRAGEIQQIASADALYWRPETAFVAGFLGRSNFVPVSGATVSGGAVTAQTVLGPIEAQLPRDGVEVPRDACIAVRPERIAVSRQEPAHQNRVQGRITSLTFFGTHVELDVEARGTLLNVHVPAVQAAQEAGLAEGAEVWLGWDADVSLVLPQETAAA